MKNVVITAACLCATFFLLDCASIFAYAFFDIIWWVPTDRSSDRSFLVGFIHLAGLGASLILFMATVDISTQL